VGAKFHASAEGTVEISGTIVICKKSTLEGEVKSPGSAAATVVIPLSQFTLEECFSNTISVLKPGTLELHATGKANGTMTLSGVEITLLSHFFGGTIHCIYTIESADVGTLEGSETTGGTATWKIGGATVTQKGTDFACGSSPKLTGSYAVTNPDYLDVDVSASATPLTSPPGIYREDGSTLDASNEGNIVLDGTVNLSCTKSTVEVEASGTEAPEGVSGPVTEMTFEGCGKNTVVALKPGTLAIDMTGSGNGSMTSSGAEITALTHNILGTVHCIYYTENTELGTFTDSRNTGSTATWKIDSVPLPRKETDFGCGSTSELTGSYAFTSPDYLAVDPGGPEEPEEPGATLTSPSGSALGVGAKIHVVSGANLVFDGTSFSVTCKRSTSEGEVIETGKVSLGFLSFEECGTSTVTVVKPGKLTVSTDPEGPIGNGTVRSSGTEITVLTHNAIGTVHCIFRTEVTDLGTVNGSKATGGTATWEINSPIPLKTTDPGCGSFELTGEYTITTPDYLDVD